LPKRKAWNSTYSIRGTGIPVYDKRAHAAVVSKFTYLLVHIKITSFLMRDSKQLPQYFNSIGIIALYYLQIYQNYLCNPNGLHKSYDFLQNCIMAGLNEEDILLKNKIADRIKFLRANTGLSQSEFSKKYEIDRQILNRWESKNNKRGLTIYTIAKFCHLIGISLKDFFDFEA